MDLGSGLCHVESIEGQSLPEYFSVKHCKQYFYAICVDNQSCRSTDIPTTSLPKEKVLVGSGEVIEGTWLKVI
jgi:hypothetical protein